MLVLALPASGRFASEGSCVSFLRSILYATQFGVSAGTREQRLLGHETRVSVYTCNWERYAAALATGNSALAYEDQTKVRRVSFIYARLPRGAKLAGSTRHTRFVCAIPGIVARCPTFAQENPRMVRIRTLRLTTNINSAIHCLNCRLQQSKTLTSHK